MTSPCWPDTMPVQLFCSDTKLNNQIAGKIFGFSFAALLAPKPKQCLSSSPIMILASDPPTNRRRLSPWPALGFSFKPRSLKWASIEFF